MRSLDLSNQGLSSLSDCQTAQSLMKVLQDCHVTKKHLRTCKLGKWGDLREEIPVFLRIFVQEVLPCPNLSDLSLS